MPDMCKLFFYINYYFQSDSSALLDTVAVDVRSFFTNGYVVIIMLYLALVVMNTLLQTHSLLVQREGARLRSAVQVNTKFLPT